jgi:ABC-type cobalamin/Fe3+-siderophores transport system ATPase subunit
MSNIITINNFNYDNLFENLTLSVEKNSFVTISASNNSGKTTLIRILTREVNTNSNIKLYDKEINEYKLDEYLKLVQSVIPKKILFTEKNLEEELLLNVNDLYNEKNEIYNFILKGLSLKKIINKNITDLTTKEIILSQVALALIEKPEVLLIDDISKYFTKKELDKIFNFLKEYRLKYNLTLISATINLNDALYTDYLYIIGNKQVELSGPPLEVLQKDNIINKIGLTLPFMIDLSVKLKDYDLIDDIELDKDRMIDKLWK